MEIFYSHISNFLDISMDSFIQFVKIHHSDCFTNAQNSQIDQGRFLETVSWVFLACLYILQAFAFSHKIAQLTL